MLKGARKVGLRYLITVYLAVCDEGFTLKNYRRELYVAMFINSLMNVNIQFSLLNYI